VITHIYHCSAASLRDYRSSGGRNRPSGTGKWPPKAGEADVNFEPPTSGFTDPDIGAFLEQFKNIDLDRPESESPIWVNWDYLERKLGLPRERLAALMHTSRQLGLLTSLSADIDHERWLKHSRVKGCLVIMTCVEEGDLRRPIADIANAYCKVVDDLVRSSPPRGLLGNGDELHDIFVVPNGHLAARAGPGLPWERALEVLQSLPPALGDRGYRAHLSSYGYEKLIKLAINAHKRGYMLCVV
jgi:hypothetical protein